MTSPARTIFLGTGVFAVPVATALADHPGVDLTAVVTAPERPGSRGRPADPPLAEWAAEGGRDMLRPARLRDPAEIARIREMAPDFLVVADYGQIVPAALLDLPRHGALNLHPSLLPRHRGATPIPAAILAGDAETGVTLMRMDPGLDTGPIVAQWRLPLSGSETAPELELRLADQAARLLATTLEHWLAGKIRPEPQDEGQATLTKPLTRADGRLDPSRSAIELERQVRAYQPWPGSFIESGTGRLLVWKARVADAVDGAETGTLVRTYDDGLGLVAADSVLVLDEVQVAGGRRMGGPDLLRGHPAWDGAHVAAPAEAGAGG